MLKLQRSKRSLTPAQLIVLAYIVLVLAGTALLSLPTAVKAGEFNNVVDALFTATSAVCVSGLAVVDIGSFYSSFGHVIILIMLQVGGLGIITATTFYTLLLGKRIGLRERVILKEALRQDALGGVVRLAKATLLITLAAEAAGALLLSIAFLKYFPPLKALWYGVFHAISAFCNSGIDLFGQEFYPYSSLAPFQQDPAVLGALAALIVLGGLGFPVIIDVMKRKRFSRLSLHSKLALVSTGGLILFGLVFFFFTEAGASWSGLGVIDRFFNSLFLSITSRTAGFSTVDLTRTVPATMLALMFFMFVGASPAGTGSGIKTTTFAIIFLAAKSRLQARGDLVVFHRRIDQDHISRALTVTVLAAGVLFICIVLLSLLDSHEMIKLMFEAFSAFGAGLSTGVTPELSAGAKAVIIFLMFFGRIGPLTLAFALLERNARADYIKYPRGNVIIG